MAAPDATALVDPEALLLGSLVMLPTEPRVVDAMADWLTLNAQAISLQRLANLVVLLWIEIVAMRLLWLALKREPARDNRDGTES